MCSFRGGGLRGAEESATGGTWLSWLFALRSELSVMAFFAQCGWRAYRYGELSADVLGPGQRGGVGRSAGGQALPEQVVVGGCEAGQL